MESIGKGKAESSDRGILATPKKATKRTSAHWYGITKAEVYPKRICILTSSTCSIYTLAIGK